MKYSIVAKYPTKNYIYIGFGGNNIAKFIDYQTLADTFILNLK